MTGRKDGVLIRGLGGLYTVDVPDEDSPVVCHARGVFRHEKITPLMGDRVVLQKDGTEGDWVIEEIAERKNSFIRPPMANLDTLLVVLSCARPATVLLTADKLIASAEHAGAEPVILITKSDLAPDIAAEMAEIYRRAGFSVFCTDSVTGHGIREFRDAFAAGMSDGITAVAGASGVGKSSLMNALFGELELRTSDVSRKTGRGRHTTRAVELYPLRNLGYERSIGYFADTPGFSALDFEHFDFMELEDLADAFREFRPYLGTCRYKKCTHLCEEGCRIVEAVSDGRISESRHESYRGIYAELKQRHPWEKS